MADVYAGGHSKRTNLGEEVEEKVEEGVESQQPDVGVRHGESQQPLDRDQDVGGGVGVGPLVHGGQHVLLAESGLQQGGGHTGGTAAGQGKTCGATGLLKNGGTRENVRCNVKSDQ